MALVTVNGVPLPTPSSYNGFTSDVVDNGRNVKGVLVADVVRKDMAKVSLKWNYLTSSEWTNILQLVKDFYVDVKFYNQSTGIFETRQMYPGDREAEMFQLKDGNPVAWLNCTLNFVEV